MTRTQAILAETMRQAALLALDINPNDEQAGEIMASMSRAAKVCSHPECSRLQPCSIHHPQPSTTAWEGHRW